tara:strand:- start:271 stop:840 length:570 start_codon:yes stop_codon:yes gene_type:complete
MQVVARRRFFIYIDAAPLASFSRSCLSERDKVLLAPQVSELTDVDGVGDAETTATAGASLKPLYQRRRPCDHALAPLRNAEILEIEDVVSEVSTELETELFEDSQDRRCWNLLKRPRGRDLANPHGPPYQPFGLPVLAVFAARARKTLARGAGVHVKAAAVGGERKVVSWERTAPVYAVWMLFRMVFDG